MKIERWVKIGEVVKPNRMFNRGLWARYAVMEFIREDGFRDYKQVFMCSWTDSSLVTAQEQIL